MIKRCSLTALIITGITLSVLAAQLVPAGTIWPRKNDFQAAIKVEVVRNSNLYDFKYVLTNLPSSKQSICYIRIEHSEPMSDTDPEQVAKGVSTFPDEGTTNRPGWDGSNFIDVEGHVGSSWAPWEEMDDIEAMRRMPVSVIKPGMTEDRFVLTGRSGPPKIAKYFLEGWTPVPRLDEKNNRIIVDKQIIENASDYADSIFKGILQNQSGRQNSVNGNTLGPALPPTDPAIICDTFILDLIGQVREAAALGWIKDDLRKSRAGDGKGDKGKGAKMERICHRPGTPAEMTLVVSTDAVSGHLQHGDHRGPCGSQDGELPVLAQTVIDTLAQIREHCMAGQFSDARSLLRNLVDLTGRERGTTLSDEAYYLIRYNAEFLLEKI